MMMMEVKKKRVNRSQSLHLRLKGDFDGRTNLSVKGKRDGRGSKFERRRGFCEWGKKKSVM